MGCKGDNTMEVRLNNRQLKLKGQVNTAVGETTFAMKEIVAILKSLKCKNAQNLANKGLKAHRINPEDLNISLKTMTKAYFYRASHFWELLVDLQKQGKINLEAANLQSKEDLIAYQIPNPEKDSYPVGHSYPTT